MDGQLMNMHHVSRGCAGVNHARVEESGGSHSAVLPHKGMGAHSMQAVPRYSGHLLLVVYVRRGYISADVRVFMSVSGTGATRYLFVFFAEPSGGNRRGASMAVGVGTKRVVGVCEFSETIFTPSLRTVQTLPAGNHITCRTWVQLGQPTPWTA